jgi:hypothetical protein
VDKAFDRLVFQSKWRSDYVPDGFVKGTLGRLALKQMFAIDVVLWYIRLESKDNSLL